MTEAAGTPATRFDKLAIVSRSAAVLSAVLVWARI